MKFRYILIGLTLLGMTSCNNWLDVTPQGQVEGSDLLTNDKGYNAALNDVYYTLTSDALYGKDLSYGMMDVLAQYWDLSAKSTNAYYRLSRFDYAHANSKLYINKVWKAMYEGIAQANYILAALQDNRDDIAYSELIEGEAYGLRAFMHMELAALFGPVIQTVADLDKPAIAYRKEFNVTAQKFESMRSVLNKAKEDLLEAQRLLADDPIIENKRYGDGNSSMLNFHSVLERRGDRMNIFAVKGLLMRVELALLNKTEAYKLADEIIRECKENELFVLANREDKLYDKNLGGEMLLGFYKNDLWEVTKNVFGFETGATNSNLGINVAQYTVFLNDLYGRAPDGSGTDNRLRYWFDKPAGNAGANYYIFKKLEETTYPGTLLLPYYPEVSVLRLAEVYYTACETMIGRDNAKALEYLNDVRESRNLSRLEGNYGDEELMEYLMREMRKDFIGEGRMFLIYKRLFREFYVKQGVTVAPTEDKFVFPIPDEEYEFSPNEKPEVDND